MRECPVTFIGYPARKPFVDKNATAKLAKISLSELMKIYKETFNIKHNRTLDRIRFLPRKQLQSETLEQFRHSLQGMAAECDFGNRTESLVHDIFILNMRRLTVQEKLYTEQKLLRKML